MNLMRSHSPLQATAGVSALLLLASGCTSANTSVTTPTVTKCQVDVSTSAASYPHNGGNGTLTVAASRDCTWSISSTANWVALSGPSSGQGDAAIAYTVAENPLPVARSGTVIVSEVQLQLSQAGAPCRYSLSQRSATVSASGGQVAVDVSTLAGCSWTASSPVGWISIATGTGGSSSGRVTLAVAANDGGTRVGTITIGGEAFTVTQNAPVPGAPSPAPAPQPSPPPSPTQVSFEGRVSLLFGRCPELLLRVDGETIATSGSTEFSKGSCADISTGDRVRGQGVRRATGTIDAAVIELKKDEE